MATHRVANDTIQPYIDAILEHHPELIKARVTIDALFAYSKDGGPAPVKLHGYPCAAIIAKNNVKARLRGLADATITFDAAHWETLSERERTALVDHEVSHIVVKRDKDEQIKEDDAGRPVIAMGLHDWELGGFRSIARRYKEDAPEVKMARAFKAKFGQLVFSWNDDNAPADDMPQIMMSGKPYRPGEEDGFEDEDAA